MSCRTRTEFLRLSTLQSQKLLSFFIVCFNESVAFSKQFCQIVTRPLMPRYESSSSKEKKVRSLSEVTGKPLDKPLFSARPNTTSAPWPKPVFDSLVSAPHRGSA